MSWKLHLFLLPLYAIIVALFVAVGALLVGIVVQNGWAGFLLIIFSAWLALIVFAALSGGFDR